MSSGKLVKLKIIQYKDDKFKKKSGPEMDVPINPSKYSRNIAIKYNEDQEQGTQGNNPPYGKTPPEEMQFEFVFDGTGVVPDSGNVEEDVKKFKELVYAVDGEIHRPNFLKIIWGPLSFNGSLKSLTINYTLFKPNGVAIRANLNATFLCVLEEERRSVEMGNNSPDLTHIRYTKEGDTLPLMTYTIYKDASLYPHVAQYNGLTNFRNLKPNTRIVFPPIDRTLK
ncbi:MAG TPA: LysM peptidoglycan-binding domain-containing protein [Pricia sp.]|nr:LysM peptidoglycan-binding domain-containing protein [Pricia sp.]